MFKSIVLIYRPIQYRSDYESLHNKDMFNLRMFYFTEAYILSKTSNLLGVNKLQFRSTYIFHATNLPSMSFIILAVFCSM